uniref:Uncharacterized protein n=1 Tax=Mesocestoides corti TaxID=53468 RepID=A0A5K3G3F9_MESCO
MFNLCSLKLIHEFILPRLKKFDASNVRCALLRCFFAPRSDNPAAASHLHCPRAGGNGSRRAHHQVRHAPCRLPLQPSFRTASAAAGLVGPAAAGRGTAAHANGLRHGPNQCQGGRDICQELPAVDTYCRFTNSAESFGYERHQAK